jgi:hypothetical protein
MVNQGREKKLADMDGLKDDEEKKYSRAEDRKGVFTNAIAQKTPVRLSDSDAM